MMSITGMRGMAAKRWTTRRTSSLWSRQASMWRPAHLLGRLAP